ncbi:cation transporter [Diplodia corticola]|uniref:Potassium transport protein n=1 Tax=Diplodia corticola TaxID=236234 RepID=A0A1J9R5A4_9PEZI|nr:cation transporter [Diplodia corticola]OJD35784.1 cation transporter [Diplodia corticola]
MVESHTRVRPSLVGPVRKVARVLRRNLPPLNFITLHYAYFFFTCLLSAVIFWGASTPARSVSFTDSLFLCVSAMTLAGLNTVNLSSLNTFQQVLLFLLIMAGSAIFVSAFVVHVRRKAFEAKIYKVVAEQKRQRHRFSLSRPRSRRSSRSRLRSAVANQKQPDAAIVRATENDGVAVVGQDIPQIVEEKPGPDDVVPKETHGQNGAPSKDDHVSFGPDAFLDTSREPRSRRHSHRLLNMQGVGARSNASLHRRHSFGGQDSIYTSRSQPTEHDDDDDIKKALKEHPSQMFPPADFAGSIGRNSQFHHLTEEEREALGGAEYKAIKVLCIIVPLYFILWQLLACIGIGAYIALNRSDTALRNGLNPWWVGAFNAVSAFNNSGMSLLDANMTAFQTAYYMLLTMGVLILAGNTCYPVFLRLIVWSMQKALPATERWDDLRHTLQFLLDHPRRCYTNLFPSQHTWWLLLSVITLNAIDWAAFEVLNIGNKAISDLPTAAEIIDGLFQALAVRSGGFYVVPITSVRISLQVLYVIMMYISVYPVVITMRNSNVYEERSLGIYADDPHLNALDEMRDEKPSFFGFVKERFLGPKGEEQTKSYFLRQQLQAQLAHDLWWLVLAVFVIMIMEGSQFERDPVNFSVFNVIFETVSGYGCVGVSTGVTYDAFSFSGSWHTLSKLVLCVVMLRGRHRGLPVAIDKAVLLPNEAQYQAEEEDAQLRMERTATRRDIV